MFLNHESAKKQQPNSENTREYAISSPTRRTQAQYKVSRWNPSSSDQENIHRANPIHTSVNSPTSVALSHILCRVLKICLMAPLHYYMAFLNTDFIPYCYGWVGGRYLTSLTSFRKIKTLHIHNLFFKNCLHPYSIPVIITFYCT